MPTVTIDGEEHQVDADSIAYGDDESPSGYVHQDDVEKIVQKRASRAERTTKEALKDDDDFFREAAKARGIELREDGQPKGSLKDDELKALRQKASKVDHLQEQVQTYESQMEETRRTQLHNSVLSSLDRPVQDGAQDDVLNVVERNAAYDDEYGWVITDTDGNVQFEGGEPVTPDQFVTGTLPEQKPYLFKSTAMDSGPKDVPGGSGGGKTYTEQEYEAASRRTHEMSQEEYSDWLSAPDEGRVK